MNCIPFVIIAFQIGYSMSQEIKTEAEAQKILGRYYKNTAYRENHKIKYNNRRSFAEEIVFRTRQMSIVSTSLRNMTMQFLGKNVFLMNCDLRQFVSIPEYDLFFKGTNEQTTTVRDGMRAWCKDCQAMMGKYREMEKNEEVIDKKEMRIEIVAMVNRWDAIMTENRLCLGQILA